MGSTGCRRSSVQWTASQNLAEKKDHRTHGRSTSRTRHRQRQQYASSARRAANAAPLRSPVCCWQHVASWPSSTTVESALVPTCWARSSSAAEQRKWLHDEWPSADTHVNPDYADFARHFSRTRRIGRGCADTREGCSIGLARVHDLVTRHNGSISIESEPGHESTCTMFIMPNRSTSLVLTSSVGAQSRSSQWPRNSRAGTATLASRCRAAACLWFGVAIISERYHRPRIVSSAARRRPAPRARGRR